MKNDLHRMTVLVTDGAGFIGSNYVLRWLVEMGGSVVNLDKVTYARQLGAKVGLLLSLQIVIHIFKMQG